MNNQNTVIAEPKAANLFIKLLDEDSGCFRPCSYEQALKDWLMTEEWFANSCNSGEAQPEYRKIDKKNLIKVFNEIYKNKSAFTTLRHAYYFKTW
jgi:hypothetical protein